MIWVTEGSSTWRKKKKKKKIILSGWKLSLSKTFCKLMICRLIVFGCSRFVNKLMDTGKGIRVLTAFISTNSYNRRINSLNCVEKRFITMTHMALKHDSLSKVCCLNLCAPVLFLNSFPGTWTPRSLWEHRICEEVKLRPSSQPSKKNLLKRGGKKWTKSRKPSANFICTVQF